MTVERHGFASAQECLIGVYALMRHFLWSVDVNSSASKTLMKLPQWYMDTKPNPFKPASAGPQDAIGPDGEPIAKPTSTTQENDPLFASAFNKAKLRRI